MAKQKERRPGQKAAPASVGRARERQATPQGRPTAKPMRKSADSARAEAAAGAQEKSAPPAAIERPLVQRTGERPPERVPVILNMIRNMVMDSYDWFVDLVADRRKLPRDEVLKLADGSIYTGRQALKNKLVDSLGGDEAIRDYLETRKVSKDLPVVDWEAPSKTSSFLFSQAASGLLNLLGYDDLPKGEDFQKFVTEKLFLDGLLSVWQGVGH